MPSSDAERILVEAPGTRDLLFFGNNTRMRHLTLGLLHARLLILDYCLGIPESSTLFTCQRWMLLQVATTAFQDVFRSLFEDIAQRLHKYEVSGLNIIRLVLGLFDKVQELLLNRVDSSATQSKFLLVLDEAQGLGRLADGYFLDSDLESTRPILAPILQAFRRVANNQDRICVIPCGTGLSYYELVWSRVSAGGQNLSKGEYNALLATGMTLDFPGWTSVDEISSYVERGLDDITRTKLTRLFPRHVVEELFRDYHGRFRPIISIIEDIIEINNPSKWRECVAEREHRLATAEIPTTSSKKELLEGNLCQELRRILTRARTDETTTFEDYRYVESTLKFALASFKLLGGLLSCKGELPALVEASFCRIRRFTGECYTVMDEPFAFRDVLSYPAEIAQNFSSEPLRMEHSRDITEIALTIDSNTIRQLFVEEHVA
ncbi:hypothetical protein BC939DRAFT_490080 [Gamsiella multidivaricata]|uniref:uncharacterized protein n=1 Tax=Gamsiella multidivaricata TaxID=101098 RepID=UPI00221FCED5|nr:uncharacterized protein BC939DRAFT_490080 [Gamsiella multidivaricata]KAI7829745.1 hypothetical protein BC939DRAFT_490080 [Gamsiella multidivaricata]